MSAALLDAIRAEAAARGETLAQAVRHHLMTGVVVRLARGRGGDAFALRGGLLTRAWVHASHARPTRDLDFATDLPFDLEATVERFSRALEVEIDDGVRIDATRTTARGLWLQTAFPGVHVELMLGLGDHDPESLGIDIGFHDPLVPPTTTIELAGTRVRRTWPTCGSSAVPCRSSSATSSMRSSPRSRAAATRPHRPSSCSPGRRGRRRPRVCAGRRTATSSASSTRSSPTSARGFDMRQ
jgi:hypothetical protein